MNLDTIHFHHKKSCMEIQFPNTIAATITTPKTPVSACCAPCGNAENPVRCPPCCGGVCPC